MVEYCPEVKGYLRESGLNVPLVVRVPEERNYLHSSWLELPYL